MVLKIFKMALKVASLNVRSLLTRKRWERVRECLQTISADIICVQECGIGWERDYGFLRKRWGKGQSWWAGAEGNRAVGAGILLNGARVRVIGVETVIEGRLQHMKVEVGGEEVGIFNVYAPAVKAERREFFRRLGTCGGGGGKKIFVGDFNCIIEEGDREGGVGGGQLDSTGKWLGNWVKEEGLQDVWKRERVGTRIDPGGKRMSRIDFVFLSEGVRVEGKDAAEVGFSDHKLLRVDLRVEEGSGRGRGVWRLNTKVLGDERVCGA